MAPLSEKDQIILEIRDRLDRLSKLEIPLDQNSCTIPQDSTVLRIYENPDGSKEICFESGNVDDYLWGTWEKSSWKSIAWLQGKQ